MEYPPCYVVKTVEGALHTHTVILLHGRGSTAQEFANDLFFLETSEPPINLRSRFSGFKWVFPDSGLRWCTSFQAERSAWFDTVLLEELDERQDLQVPGLKGGIRWVKSVVESEVAILNGEAHRVILGGFSQGSVTAFLSILTGAAMRKGRLGTFVGLSAWIPFLKQAKAIVEQQSVEGSGIRTRNLMSAFSRKVGGEPLASAEATGASCQVPVYLGHGTDDAVISISNYHDVANFLVTFGARAEVKEYIGADREGHWLKAPKQVDDLVEYIVRVLGVERASAVEEGNC